MSNYLLIKKLDKENQGRKYNTGMDSNLDF